MRHVSARSISDTRQPAQAANRRVLAKQKTRERVLQGARELFAQHGYEGATIRDIAAQIGLSTGAVFASFSDKSELFEIILLADIAAIDARMDERLALGGDLDEMLAALFQTVLDHNRTQLPILKSALAMSWIRDQPALTRASDALQGLREKITQAVTLAITRGDLSAEADPALIARLLWDAYLADLRRVVFGVGTAEEVAERQRRQAGVILRGYRAG